MGAAALHRGNIAEMKTGEGKTLVATMPAYLNALDRQGRAPRHRQRLPGQARLGVDGPDLPSARRPRRADPVADDTRGAPPRVRRADITYGTNNEFGFDYLRDNMAMRIDDWSSAGISTPSWTRSTRS